MLRLIQSQSQGEAAVQDEGFQMKHCIFFLAKDVWYLG